MTNASIEDDGEEGVSQPLGQTKRPARMPNYAYCADYAPCQELVRGDPGTQGLKEGFWRRPDCSVTQHLHASKATKCRKCEMLNLLFLVGWLRLRCVAPAHPPGRLDSTFCG